MTYQDLLEPGIAHDETLVWTARVSTFGERESELRDLLSDDERTRADRFHRSEDRVRYVVAHGLFRTVLGRYLGKAPRAVRFTLGAYGKPVPVADGNQLGIGCNLAHAGDVVAIAITRGRAVGIDVEYVADSDFDSIVALCFAPQERRALAALPAHARRAAFFATWTRKEAYVKALGIGIDDRLAAFEVAVGSELPQLYSDARDPHASERWNLRDIDVPPGYAGSVAEAAPSGRLRQSYLEVPV